ncbi:MAG TPA: hypothetical protein VMT03_12515 [Polyangia bacterium]|nr:hypothetical protein [Polyangia bacterium]
MPRAALQKTGNATGRLPPLLLIVTTMSRSGECELDTTPPAEIDGR